MLTIYTSPLEAVRVLYGRQGLERVSSCNCNLMPATYPSAEVVRAPSLGNCKFCRCLYALGHPGPEAGGLQSFQASRHIRPRVELLICVCQHAMLSIRVHACEPIPRRSQYHRWICGRLIAACTRLVALMPAGRSAVRSISGSSASGQHRPHRSRGRSLAGTSRFCTDRRLYPCRALTCLTPTQISLVWKQTCLPDLWCAIAATRCHPRPVSELYA